MRLFFLSLVLPCVLIAQQEGLTCNSIDPTLLENADAVVRLDQTEITVERQDYMQIESKRVVTVLNKDGERFVHAYVGYDKNDKVLDLEARVYDKLGKEIKKFKEKDFVDQSAVSGGTLYSDSRMKFLRYTPTAYPYTVVFEKKTGTINTAFLPNWYFLDGYNVSVEKSHYKLNVLPSIAVRHKTYHFEKFGVRSDSGPVTYEFSAGPLTALKRETLSPPFSEIAPLVKLALERFHIEGIDGEAKDWNGFGIWMYERLLRDQANLDESTVAKIRQLVNGAMTNEEKVRTIYEYVQNNTRYISVQLGIGGWMPIAADEVDRVKYGDCKGLTNYTKALLDAVGIPSYYTVVHAGRQAKDIDPSFPAMQGNHVILNVPLGEREIWLECTSQRDPVDFHGTFTDNRKVLRVTPEGGEIVSTKTYTAEDSALKTIAQCNLGADGSIKASVELESTGIQYANRDDLPMKKKDELETYYKEYWSDINDLSIDNITLDNDKNQIVFTEKVVVNASNYASVVNNELLFAPNMFNKNRYVPKRHRHREQDMVIARGYHDIDEFIIQLPEGYSISSMLQDLEIKNDFGMYLRKIELLDPNRIKYSRELIIRAGRYDKADYESYRNFKKKVARSDNSRIVLTKTEP